MTTSMSAPNPPDLANSPQKLPQPLHDSPRPLIAAPLAWNRSVTAFVILLLIIGAALRTAQWARWRCLWVDEIYLASSFHRSVLDLLFKPLDALQAAPPGWLLLGNRTSLKARA